MKTLRIVFYGLLLLLLTSCSAPPSLSKNADSLVLTLELTQREVHSFGDIRCQVILSNQSDSDILVHKRLYWMSSPAPPYMTELAILISDSSGKPVDEMGFFVNRQFPGEDTLDVLKPGEQIGKTIYLKGGFHENTFKKGEKYTIVVIYQNDIDVKQTLGGVDVSSWVGSARSNNETFVILP